MENPEEVLQSLDEFAKLKPKDIPRELEDYLSYVARTGDPVYQWSIVKCLFREKLLNVITDFYETSPTIDLQPCPNVDPFNYDTMKNSLLERLDSFPSAPFTVQRLCELLTSPRKEYRRADKFMRAIEKNILVVSTREPGNGRRSDNNGQPELLMNGVMDGRGIELGEAIETVSSDGVNLMHSDENEVNVTENENVVPVECAGMEEIDMEEHGDHIEASNSNVWEKEQSEVSEQSEGDGSLNYDGNSVEGENKSKESLECFEVSSTENGESGCESADVPVTTENVADSVSVVVSGESPPELDACSSSSKEHLDKTEENSDVKIDSPRSELNLTSENSAVEDEVPKQTNEETAGNFPPEETETTSTSSEQELQGISSSAEDLSKGGTNIETVPAGGDSSDETSTGNVTPETVSSEPATSSIETTCATDSTATELPFEETSANSVNTDTDVSAAEETSTEDVTDSALVPSDTVSTDASENGKVHEAASSSPPAEGVTYEDVSENNVDSKTGESAVVSQQDEAMEIDDSNASSQLVTADTDEPMDQCEQPTEN